MICTENFWQDPNGISLQSALVLHISPSRSQFDGVAGTTQVSADTRCGSPSPHFSHPDGTGGSTNPCISGGHIGASVSPPLELLPSLVPLPLSVTLAAPVVPVLELPVVVAPVLVPLLDAELPLALPVGSLVLADAPVVVGPPLPVDAVWVVSPAVVLVPAPPEPHAPRRPSASNKESRAGSLEV